MGVPSSVVLIRFDPFTKPWRCLLYSAEISEAATNTAGAPTQLAVSALVDGALAAGSCGLVGRRGGAVGAGVQGRRVHVPRRDHPQRVQALLLPRVACGQAWALGRLGARRPERPSLGACNQHGSIDGGSDTLEWPPCSACRHKGYRGTLYTSHSMPGFHPDLLTTSRTACPCTFRSRPQHSPTVERFEDEGPARILSSTALPWWRKFLFEKSEDIRKQVK